MQKRTLIGFLSFIGILLIACGVEQSQVVTAEVTRVIPNTGTITTETPTLIQETFTATITPTSTPRLDSVILPGVELQVPRSQHTATLLPDGKILLVGGSMESDGFVADQELIDPITGESAWTTPIGDPRHGHTATLLQDGRVLIIGGYNLPKQWIDGAEVYDPQADTWISVAPIYSHGVNHTATLMKDGRVLVVGGCVGSGVCSNRVEIFDPITMSWSEATPLEYDRASHTAQLLEDGRVLVAGGSGSINGSPLDGDALIYNPQTNVWSATGQMIKPRIFSQSVRLPDGHILVAGGINVEDTLQGGENYRSSTSAEVYDPTSNEWTAVANLSQGRHGFSLILLPNNQVLAVGGANKWDCCWTYDSFPREIEVYDPTNNLWSTIGELPYPMVHATATLLPDGRVWVAGGRTDTIFLSNTWLIAAPDSTTP